MFIGCKITKTSSLTRKTACKRLYFNYFKERLVHFNGTVVIGNNNTVFQGYEHAITCLYQLMNRHRLFFEFIDKEDHLQERNININREISATLFNEELPLIHSSLPVSVAEIGDRAFYHCSYLKWIGVEGCTKFGEDIFDGCKLLKKVILPQSRHWMLEGHIPLVVSKRVRTTINI